MEIRLLAFATAADALGTGEQTLALPEGLTTVADLRGHLTERHPDLTPLWPRLAVAVDGRVVGPETALEDGAEVALLPPVSGGAPEPRDAPPDLPSEGGPPHTALVETPLDVPAILSAVASPTRGAVLLFLGTVRNHHQGQPVTALTYSAYRPMAEERLATIVGELQDAGEDLAVALVHRLGEVAAGEASVAIAVASPHRAASYEASRTALERLKKEVPIWKREHYGDGTARWREEEPLGVDGAASQPDQGSSRKTPPGAR